MALTVFAAATLVGCTPSGHHQASGTVRYQAPKDLVLGRQQLARIVDGLPASSPQRAILADGKVSEDELALSWKRLRSCLDAKGFSVSGPVMNPITNTDYLYTYSRNPKLGASAAPDNPTDEEIASECEATFWNPVAQVYAANTPQRMSEGLATFMAHCMSRAKFPSPSAATFDAFARDHAGAAVDPARLKQANTCLDRGVPELYPNLPYYPRP